MDEKELEKYLKWKKHFERYGEDLIAFIK